MRDEKIPWRWVLGAVFLWLFLGLANLAITGNATVAGSVADAFGIASSFFSALALVGVIWAIRLQSTELELQRIELTRSSTAQIATERSLFLSAYLNSIATTISAYVPVMAESDTRFRVAKRSHLVLTLELEWLLSAMRTSRTPPERLPTRCEAVQSRLAMLGEHLSSIGASLLEREDLDSLKNVIQKLGDDLVDLTEILGTSGDEWFLSVAVRDIAKECKNHPIKMKVFIDPNTFGIASSRVVEQTGGDPVGNASVFIASIASELKAASER